MAVVGVVRGDARREAVVEMAGVKAADWSAAMIAARRMADKVFMSMMIILSIS